MIQANISLMIAASDIAADQFRALKSQCIALQDARASLQAAGRTMSAADEAALLATVSAALSAAKTQINELDRINDATECLVVAPEEAQ